MSAWVESSEGRLGLSQTSPKICWGWIVLEKSLAASDRGMVLRVMLFYYLYLLVIVQVRASPLLKSGVISRTLTFSTQSVPSRLWSLTPARVQRGRFVSIY